MSVKNQKIDPHLRSTSVSKRMAEAVRRVLEDGMSQSEAARRCGVSRSRVNVNVQAQRRKLAEQRARAEDAMAHRLAEFEKDRPHETQVSVEDAQGTEVAPEAPEGPLLGPEVPEATQPPVVELRRIQPPGEFIRTYFGSVICPDCGVHHEVPSFHDEILDKTCDPALRRLLVNLAPYHAKSTVGTVYSTVYEVCRDPNSRTALVSKSERLAKRFLYQIQKFLIDHSIYTDGPNLIDDWGPFHNTNTWSSTEFVVAGRQSSEKDPTVSAYGVGAQIYGYRFDRMIFDDIADLENQRNPDRVAEMIQWATQECASRVGKTGKLLFFGTRVSPQDIYSHLEQLPAYQVVRYPCIIDEQEQSTLWPEHFPYRSAVEQRDSMSLEQFQLVYQNVDTPGFGAAFPLEVLERSQDTSRPLGHYDPAWRLVLGVDPAGGGEQAGYTAMVVLGVDLTSGERFIVDMVNHKQMRAPQIKDQILEFCDQYPIAECRVEMNGLQSQLFQYDTELIQKLTQRGIRLAPHITTGRNKWDENFGVEAMGPMFYNNQISCPYMDINSRKKTGELHSQLSQFPMGKVSDLVMALWFANLGCQDMFQRFKLPSFDSRMKVPARIRRGRHVVDFGEQRVRQPHDHEIGEPTQRPERRNYVNMPGGISVG